jgi:hypothetical protein
MGWGASILRPCMASQRRTWCSVAHVLLRMAAVHGLDIASGLFFLIFLTFVVPYVVFSLVE